MAAATQPSQQHYMTTAPNINDLVPRFNLLKSCDEECLCLNDIALVRPKTENLPIAI